jgi:hypothetical protein
MDAFILCDPDANRIGMASVQKGILEQIPEDDGEGVDIDPSRQPFKTICFQQDPSGILGIRANSSITSCRIDSRSALSLVIATPRSAAHASSRRST